VTWTPPRDDGGSTILNYLLEMKHPSDMKWSAVNVDFTIPTPEHTVTGLKAETEYMFRVTAQNKAGPGKPSAPSDVAKYGEFHLMEERYSLGEIVTGNEYDALNSHVLQNTSEADSVTRSPPKCCHFGFLEVSSAELDSTLFLAQIWKNTVLMVNLNNLSSNIFLSVA
jgi:hypothetical protein